MKFKFLALFATESRYEWFNKSDTITESKQNDNSKTGY